MLNICRYLRIVQYFISFWLLFGLSVAHASMSLPKNTLPAPLQAKLQQAHINPFNVSIVVQPIDKKQVFSAIVDFYGDENRTPASTQKLIPTFIALDSLGENFVWQTKIFQQGTVFRGTLYGDIILKSSGDPKLSAEQLTFLFNMIKSQGIHTIDGDLIVDTGLFQHVKFDPNAFDGEGLRPYNASPNSMLINFGTLHLDMTLADDKLANAKKYDKNNPPVFNIKSSPTLANFDIPTQVNAGSTACRKKFEKPIIAVSTQNISFTEAPAIACGNHEYWLTFPDGDVMVNKIIQHQWQQLFPNFQGQIVAPNQAKTPKKWQFWRKRPAKLIAYASSNPLSEIISDINHFSNNVMTEQVLLSLPIYANAQPTSDYPKSFAFVKNWWQQRLPNLPAPVMTRGSGLCRDCSIKPHSMIGLLNYAYQSEHFASFQHSLPIAGQTGTMKALKDRHPNHPAIGKAWIKTGTLDNVVSMAGYVQGQSGQMYAVMGVINSDNVKNSNEAKALLDEMLAWTVGQ